MRVYFTTSFDHVISDAKHLESIRAIQNSILQADAKLSCRILKAKYGPDNENGQKDNLMGNIFEFRNESIKEIHTKTLKRINQADVIISEVSNLGPGVAFEISNALAQRKSVLLLSHIQSKTELAEVIAGHTSKTLEIKQYADISKIDSIIKTFLKKAKKLLDIKFLLNITPEIDRYMDWASKKKKLHKSQVMRQAMEEYMSQDPVWANERDDS